MTGAPLIPPAPLHVLVPGPIDTATGGFAYDRQMIAALAGCGRLGRVIVLPDRFPNPGPATVALAARALQALPAGAWLLVDGLCLTPLIETLRGLPSLKLIALVHHPLGDETGLRPLQRAAWLAREAAALADARAVIVTSEATAQRLRALGVDETRIRVAPPGVDGTRRARLPAMRVGAVPRILCVGGFSPRKGQDVLLRALARLRTLRWRLILLGPRRDRAYARRLRLLIAGLKLGSRISDLGVVSARTRDRHYAQAFVLAMPSRYEGYGMVLAEAVAAGLPVIASALPTSPEALPLGCRLLVPVDDPPALARALRWLLRQPAHRQALARAARRHAPRLRRWDQAKARFLAALAEVMAS